MQNRLDSSAGNQGKSLKNTLSLKTSDTLDLSLLPEEAKVELMKKVNNGTVDLHLEAQKNAQDLQLLQAKLGVINDHAHQASQSGNATKISDQVGNSKFTVENAVSSGRTLKIIAIIAAVVVILALIMNS